MDVEVQLPFIFDVEKNLPMRVTLYPTGHLAVGLEEFLKEQYDLSAVPPDLALEVQAYLKKEYSGKELNEEHGKRISEEIACIARAHLNKNKKALRQKM